MNIELATKIAKTIFKNTNVEDNILVEVVDHDHFCIEFLTKNKSDIEIYYERENLFNIIQLFVYDSETKENKSIGAYVVDYNFVNLSHSAWKDLTMQLI